MTVWGLENWNVGQSPFGKFDSQRADVICNTNLCKKVNSPSTYPIHCDVIDDQNPFQREKVWILAKFDVKGLLYGNVSYDASPQQVFRDRSTDAFITGSLSYIWNDRGNSCNLLHAKGTFAAHLQEESRNIDIRSFKLWKRACRNNETASN